MCHLYSPFKPVAEVEMSALASHFHTACFCLWAFKRHQERREGDYWLLFGLSMSLLEGRCNGARVLGKGRWGRVAVPNPHRSTPSLQQRSHCSDGHIQ